MNGHGSVDNSLAYGRKLVDAGITGARMGRENLGSEALSTLLSSSAQDSLKMAAAGACLGLSFLLRRRNRISGALGWSALGSALGFCAGFAWKTRKLTSTVAHSTLRELRRASDEHWLELNPIDYA
jgi:hypothetical protein